MCDCATEALSASPLPTVTPERVGDLPLTRTEREQISPGSWLHGSVTRRAQAAILRARSGEKRSRWRNAECEGARASRISPLALARPLVAAVADTASAPLPWALRRKFERALDISLADVRLHDGAGATRAARSLNTPAYALGDSIVIDESAMGGEAEIEAQIAHEIAHVLQQRARGPYASRARLEYEADVFAEALRLGAPTPRLSAAPPRSLLLARSWLECASICTGAGGGTEGIIIDWNLWLNAKGICRIDDCGTTVTPAVQAQGWCVFSCMGEGKTWAVFYIKTRCGFVGPSWVNGRSTKN